MSKRRYLDDPPEVDAISSVDGKDDYRYLNIGKGYDPTKPYHPIYNHPQGGELHPLGEDYVPYIPIVGTGLDVINAANSPTKENITQAGVSAILDALSLGSNALIKSMTKPTGKIIRVQPWTSPRRARGIRRTNYYSTHGINPLPFIIGDKIITAPVEYLSNHPELWGNETQIESYNNKHDTIRRHYKLGGSTRHSLKDGGIYIKPSHRGRFTALKERTGHSSTWFEENGTPAQKKMATFALNAAKWKH